ncbi:Phosphatidylinositol N-acetylglucosaminyltransferase GPI3 subunit [Cryptotrichosporon argae]
MPTGEKIVYHLRIALYTILLVTVSFWAIGIGLVATLFGQRLNTNYYVARTFWHVAGPLIGWDIEVEGEEHLWRLDDLGDGRSAVLVGNHQSALDILYLGRIFPKHAAIMAKKELKMLPGLGWFMMLSGTVFINRSNNRSAVASLQHAGEEMKRKRISLWIFPEGTRFASDEPDLLPFKKGAFYLATQSQIPIVPVVVQNYSHLLKKGRYFRRGKLRVKVLSPISTEGLTTADVPALTASTRETMLETLRDISGPSPSSSIASTPEVPLRRSGAYVAIPSAPSPLPSEEAEVDAALSLADSAVPTSSIKSPSGSDTGAPGYSIAMVSDFFLPAVGGVEAHIYYLSVELMRRGHRVVVITHHHGPRVGVRHLAPGLKVYHLPFVPIARDASLPNFLLFLPYFRQIVLRERVALVHAHGSLSSLAHEAVLHAPLFGAATVFTDHSLFGFADAVGVLTNKLLADALRNVDAAICVSHTGRENTVLRAELEPETVSVIPNAILSSQYTPDPSRADPDWITIVVVSRLVYRKGIDLLIASAPTICARFPRVRFLVGGAGPKMVDLLQMRERHRLHERVTLLGPVDPADVCGVLNRGHIYLSTSLTEAFGISIVEAASAGLFVVGTRVGGVPEILPEDMIEFAHADEDDIVRALTHAIHVVQAGTHDPVRAHARVRDMYSWAAVAARTEAVYAHALARPRRDTWERAARLRALGPVFGLILCVIMAVQHMFNAVLEWCQPEDEVDVVEDTWNDTRFTQVFQKADDR